MKKILRFIPTIVLALLLMGCYTNVIDLDGEGGGNGNGNGNGGGVEDGRELVISDHSQLNRQIFAESQFCEVTFTSKSGWEVNGLDDDQTRKWISVSPLRSDVGGAFTLSIGVDENATGNDRFATLQLYSGGDRENIHIAQLSTYNDGTLPQPYERDAYTDIVERIAVQNYFDGEIDPSLMEWRFMTNFESGQVEAMEAIHIEPNDQRLQEVILMHNYRVLERTAYGVLWGGMDGVVYNLYSEISLNDYDFITGEQMREFDYRNEENPEPTFRARTYLYSNYRRVSERSNNTTNEYRWMDGNMVERTDENSHRTEFVYGERNNDRANIDLNTFLYGDMYAAIGLLGKRSRNLMTSIIDYKGGVAKFDYTFDTKGRVQTVARRYSFNGVTEPTTSIFIIYYIDGNL